jgi:hypothetical protein
MFLLSCGEELSTLIINPTNKNGSFMILYMENRASIFGLVKRIVFFSTLIFFSGVAFFSFDKARNTLFSDYTLRGSQIKIENRNLKQSVNIYRQQSTNSSLTFLLSLPKQFNHDRKINKKYPLLVFLHGAYQSRPYNEYEDAGSDEEKGFFALTVQGPPR